MKLSEIRNNIEAKIKLANEDIEGFNQEIKRLELFKERSISYRNGLQAAAAFLPKDETDAT